MKIKNEKELIDLIKEDINNSSSQNIILFAGHLPLLYNKSHEQKNIVELGEFRWGVFSLYTFELGCLILQYCIDIGKKGKIIILVDDDIELPKVELTNGRIKRKDENKFKKPRRRLMKNSKLPESYKKVLIKYNLNYEHFIYQERDNVKTFLISEKILKKEGESKFGLSHNECSLAYKSLLLNPKYFSISDDYLISFMPLQCKGNICEVIGSELKINSSHFFFPDINKMGGLIEMKNEYLNSNKRAPLENKKDFYESQLASYRKDKLID